MSKNPPPVTLDFHAPLNVRGAEPEIPEPEGLSDAQADELAAILNGQAEGPEADRARAWAAEREW